MIQTAKREENKMKKEILINKIGRELYLNADMDQIARAAYDIGWAEGMMQKAKRDDKDAKEIKEAMMMKIKIDAMSTPPVSRILHPVPDGVDCQKLLFVGKGKSSNIGKSSLSCLKQVYYFRTPCGIGSGVGYAEDMLYAIDLNYPIEKVNEALSRFGFDTLDRVYYPMSSLPKSGLVGVLYESGDKSLLDCEYIRTSGARNSRIGWRPEGGIKGAE